MGIGRQVQLRWGGQILSLNDGVYVLRADDGWRCDAGRVAIRVLVRAGTLTELDRRVTAIRQVISQADAYQERMVGERVELWTKTCDDLALLAELGATWMRARVHGGRVDVLPVSGLAAAPDAMLQITLTVDESWQRARPESVLECRVGASNVSSLSDGGVLSASAMELWARRLYWSSTTGLTMRFFWRYGGAASNQINFGRLSGNMRCYWGHAASRWYLRDDAGTQIETSVSTLVTGQVYEIVARWSPGAGGMALFVDGVKRAERASAIVWPSNPEGYQVLAADEFSGAQGYLSVQAWPTALTDAQIAGLRAWGRPGPEMAWYVAPADLKARSALYLIHNGPGEAPAPLRLMTAPVSQAQGQVRLALRALRYTGTLRLECESGTLGGGTATNSNAAASGGSQARFTPANADWGTRVTATVAATPALVGVMRGEYRLYLAGYDSAAGAQINQVRWRLVVAGVAGGWSPARAFAAVSKRSLLDLGTLTLPPGNWPVESAEATSAVYGGAGAYVIIELQARNTAGSGGGTLDMDALWLAPAEAESRALASVSSTAWLLLDWTQEPPAFITVSDGRSLEFAGWTDYVGDDIELPPSAGQVAGTLLALWQRDAAEEFYPNDEAALHLLYSPRWRL